MRARLGPLGVRVQAASRGLWLFAVFMLVPQPQPHAVCLDCHVDFVPALTDQRCPICGWLAVPITAAPRRRPLAVRGAGGLGLAWFTGVLVFALLAHALYS